MTKINTYRIHTKRFKLCIVINTFLSIITKCLICYMSTLQYEPFSFKIKYSSACTTPHSGIPSSSCHAPPPPPLTGAHIHPLWPPQSWGPGRWAACPPPPRGWAPRTRPSRSSPPARGWGCYRRQSRRRTRCLWRPAPLPWWCWRLPRRRCLWRTPSLGPGQRAEGACL